MSFDEEHLDDHYLCQREVAERDQRILVLERALDYVEALVNAYGAPYQIAALAAKDARIAELEKALRQKPLHVHPEQSHDR